MAQRPIELVVERLEAAGCDPRPHGQGWRAHCPAHADNTPSLDADEGDDGRALLFCHAGCDRDTVLDRLGLDIRQLFADDPERRNGDGFEIVARYPYVDEAGQLLFEVVRLSPKGFRQRRPDGQGGWVWKLGDTRRVLYRLPEVLAAAAAGGRVFVTEGEKDANALARAGAVATTNPGGAGKWRREYAEALRGAEVVVVADRDDAGYAHAEQVAASLRPVAASVAVVESVEGKDASDHLAAGHTPEELLIVESGASPPASPPTKEGDEASPALFRRWRASELAADADQPLRWRVRGMFIDPTYAMLAGEEKTLKTYLGLFVYVGVASGVPVFGHFKVDEAAPVVVYIGEGGRQPYGRRLARVARAMGVDLDNLPFVGSHDVGALDSERFRQTLERDLTELRPGLVGIDPLYAYHPRRASGASLFEEGAMLAELSATCGEAGASLLVTHHFNQTGTGGGLKRMTMAGGAEWSDSWLLVHHREAPDVVAGKFHLGLEVGSRQWGGSTWELDLDVGRFDHDANEHLGEITWDLRRGGTTTAGDVERVVEMVTTQPGRLTREDLAKALGIRVSEARAVVDKAERGKRIVPRLIPGAESGRRQKAWLYVPGQVTSEAGTAGTGVG